MGTRVATPSLNVASVLALALALVLAGCGVARNGHGAGTTPHATQLPGGGPPRATPRVIEPVAGQQGSTTTNQEPVGDPNSFAPPLSEVRAQLKLELVAARTTSGNYVDPLQYVDRWERTDQGVDAGMPVGAPIFAPGEVKVLAVIPDWYLTQPLVYFELLDGPDAGRVQYVAEQITDIAKPGLILSPGQVIARYAGSGTGIEYGWSTPDGTTLAVATSGYEEGEITPAGRSMRAWLNALGAGAGPNT